MGTPALKTRGLRHLALRVEGMEKALWFYRDLLGFEVVWQPDGDNGYLSSGCDNLALHREARLTRDPAALDHLGVLVGTPDEVQSAETALAEAGVTILEPTRKHRDDSVSCYVADPDGNRVQILFEPTISPMTIAGGNP